MKRLRSVIAFGQCFEFLKIGPVSGNRILSAAKLRDRLQILL